MLFAIILVCSLCCLCTSLHYNGNNNIKRFNNNVLFAKKPAVDNTPEPAVQQDNSKYFVAVGVFVFAALFDKFVYHADPAHDDALYKSNQSVKIK